MELRPVGWTLGAGFDVELNDNAEWFLTGYRVGAAFDVSIDRSKIFWARFRAWYSASTGTVENGEKLATLDSWDIGIGILAGLRLYESGEQSISLFAGYGLGFGMMDVQTTEKGEEKWDPDCPTFAEVMEDPKQIKCWIEGMDGSFTSGKFLAEVAIDFGPLTATPFYEYSMNNTKRGRVMSDHLHKVGMMVGFEF